MGLYDRLRCKEWGMGGSGMHAQIFSQRGSCLRQSPVPGESPGKYWPVVIGGIVVLVLISLWCQSPTPTQSPDEPLPATRGFTIDTIEPGYPAFHSDYPSATAPHRQAYEQAYALLSGGPVEWRDFPPNNTYEVPLSVYQEIFDLFGFEIGTPIPTSTPRPTYTGEELSECLSSATTPPERRVDCETAQALATLDIIGLTNWETSDLTNDRRVVLAQAVEDIDALLTDVEQALYESANSHPSIHCQGVHSRLKARVDVLATYRQENADLPILYFDYKLAFLTKTMATIEGVCAEAGYPLSESRTSP